MSSLRKKGFFSTLVGAGDGVLEQGAGEALQQVAAEEEGQEFGEGEEQVGGTDVVVLPANSST